MAACPIWYKSVTYKCDTTYILQATSSLQCLKLKSGRAVRSRSYNNSSYMCGPSQTIQCTIQFTPTLLSSCPHLKTSTEVRSWSRPSHFFFSDNLRVAWGRGHLHAILAFVCGQISPLMHNLRRYGLPTLFLTTSTR